jgi:hypothetical protein
MTSRCLVQTACGISIATTARLQQGLGAEAAASAVNATASDLRAPDDPGHHFSLSIPQILKVRQIDLVSSAARHLR